MAITLKHQGTGEVKVLNEGWSWSLFLGAGFLGIPLFFRGLIFWGVVMMGVWSFRLALPVLDLPPATAGSLATLLTIVVTAMCFFLGLKGNALSIGHYKACGYKPVDEGGMDDRIAAQLWAKSDRVRPRLE